MKTVNQVYATTDYSMFKELQGNRTVNALHVRRLRESFKSAYLLSPIIVNEDYEIIDGQHRFAAAKELLLPVNYIVCAGYKLQEVQLLNTNMKNWKSDDYLKAYCDLKYPQYLKFREFMQMFPDFGFASCETILSNLATPHLNLKSKELISETNTTGTYMVRSFEEGNLNIPNFQKSVETAKKIQQIKPYYDGYNRATFVRAMIGLFKIDHYSHQKMIDRLEANPTFMQHCSNVGQYKAMLEEIYNFRSRQKVTLRF